MWIVVWLEITLGVENRKPGIASGGGFESWGMLAGGYSNNAGE